MSGAPRDSYKDSDSRHLAAVARSLRWADEAAERGEYRDALGWLQAVEAAGEKLSDAYQARRNAWLVAIAIHRSEC
jgi:hypothetical protein